jgi:integrative and conjugative element protein (TIGR02256 family)
LTEALAYSLPGDLGTLIMESDVLAHFEAHKQRKWLSKEAGGQLFATFDDMKTVRVVEATGPRATDKRSLFAYRPDRLAEKVEIADRFAKGLHFIGDWHTHCQKFPEPSPTDEWSMRDLVRLSTHGLMGFALVVVGQADFPDGLHVSFHSPSASSMLTVAERGNREDANHPASVHGQ